MNSVQAAVDGEALALERQYALNNSTGSEKTASKYFVAKFNRSKADRSQKFEIEIGTFQNEKGRLKRRMRMNFHLQQIQKFWKRIQRRLTFKPPYQLRKIRRFCFQK